MSRKGILLPARLLPAPVTPPATILHHLNSRLPEATRVRSGSKRCIWGPLESGPLTPEINRFGIHVGYQRHSGPNSGAFSAGWRARIVIGRL